MKFTKSYFAKNNFLRVASKKRDLNIYSWVILFACFFSVELSGQNQLYQIQQVEGTELELKELIANHVTSDDSLVSLIYFAPYKCPRCEGIFDFFLEKVDSSTFNHVKVVGIPDYPKQTVVKKYLKKNDWNFNSVIFDTESEFSKMFNFTSNRLKVPFLLLVDARSGKLLNSNAFLGLDCTDEFVDDFFTARPNLQQSKISSFSNRKNTSSQNQLVFDEVIELKENDSIQYSVPYSFNLSKDNDFVFIDEILGDIFIYDAKGNPKSVLSLRKKN